MPLPPDIAALQAQVRQLEAENLWLRQENKSLRDMVAFLKQQREE
jgi:cell division protein FtsB